MRIRNETPSIGMKKMIIFVAGSFDFQLEMREKMHFNRWVDSCLSRCHGNDTILAEQKTIMGHFNNGG